MKILCTVEVGFASSSYIVEISRDTIPTELEDDLDAQRKITIEQVER